MTDRMPHAGDLKDQVAIQRQKYPATADEYGAPIEEWETIATRRARVRDANGRELWLGRQVEPEVSLSVDLYYLPELAVWRSAKEGPKMRLLDKRNGDRILHIAAVLNPDGDKRFLTLVCKR